MNNIKLNIFQQIIRSIYGILNLLVILWLLACLYASWYNPNGIPSYWSLLSFSNLFAVSANIIFIIIWLLSKRKKYAIFSIITLTLCWNITSSVFGIHLLNLPSYNKDEENIKIMSWNVHMFDLGEWTKDKATYAKMLKLIKDEQPDILCMQEYYRDSDNYNEPYAGIIRELGYAYESFMPNSQWNKSKMTINAKKGEYIDVGTIIYSKYPITNKIHKKLINTKGQGTNIADIELKSGKKISLATVHLTSFQINDNELSYIDSLKTTGIDAAQKTSSKGLVKKLMNASAQRSIAANEVSDILNTLENPIIICGDFNDLPGSYVYTKIKGGLGDAFINKGFGVGNTYQKILPILRIDYLFYDDDAFIVTSFKKEKVGLSDHYPIFVTLKIK